MLPFFKENEMGAYIEIAYCHHGAFGNSYGSGSTRMYQNELALWLQERTRDGRPILITDIRVIKGELEIKVS